jgi:hypothetical protein
MEVPMRKLAIGIMAAAGVALAGPAGAQVVYETVPAATVVAPAPTYTYVVPPAPMNVYTYSNGGYSYSNYTYANGCHVTAIRDYGQVTVERNCY